MNLYGKIHVQIFIAHDSDDSLDRAYTDIEIASKKWLEAHSAFELVDVKTSVNMSKISKKNTVAVAIEYVIPCEEQCNSCGQCEK